MEAKETGPAALAREFVAAGLDATGIDLARLAGMKHQAEVRIAACRQSVGFHTADPAFAPSGSGLVPPLRKVAS